MEIIDLLIVEDNEQFINIFKDRLKYSIESTDEFIFNIDISKNLKDCKEKIESGQNYDLVLLDLQLPDIHWTETIKTYLNFSSIPFCVVSALPSKSYALKSISLGAQDYILKSDRRNFKERLFYALIRSKSAVHVKHS